MVEKMGFGTTLKRYEIYSKPQPLLQKTCIFYAFKTLAACVGVCLRTNALACICRLLPMYMGRGQFWSLFPKIDFYAFKKLYFSF